MSLWQRFKRWRRIRAWRPEHHDDCLSFLGPCNLCVERLEYVAQKRLPLAKLVNK